MEQHTKLWYLKQFDLFHKMKEADIKSIEDAGHARSLKKNALLRFSAPLHHYVYLLKEGAIKICLMDESGKELIKYLIKPGNIFGEIPLLGVPEDSDEYAVALEDSVICFLDTGKLEQWMQKNKDLRINVYRMIGVRVKKVENRLASLIFKDAPTRITEFIIDFAMEFGKPKGQSYEVKNFLTQDDIAKLTATSRQTVSAVLNDLRERQLIYYDHQLIRVYFSSPPPVK